MTTKTGSEIEYSPDKHANTMKIVDDLSGQALRVLAVSVKIFTEEQMPFKPKDEDCKLSTDEKFAAVMKDGVRLMGTYFVLFYICTIRESGVVSRYSWFQGI